MTYLGEVSGKIYQETSFTGKGSIPGSGSVTQMAVSISPPVLAETDEEYKTILLGGGYRLEITDASGNPTGFTLPFLANAAGDDGSGTYNVTAVVLGDLIASWLVSGLPSGATGMRLTAYASFIFQPVYPVA